MSGFSKGPWAQGVLTLVLVLVAFPVSALEVKFGIKGGYQYSTTTYDKDEDRISSLTRVFYQNQDWASASALGIYGVAPLSAVAAIQVEILYNRRGTKLVSKIPVPNEPYYNGPITAYFTEKGLTLTYVDIPMMARIGPAAWDVYGLAGFSVGIPVDQKISIAEDGVEQQVSIEDMNRTDVALVAGAGVDLGPVEVEIRYNHGIRSLDKWGANRLKNRHWAALLGIPF